MRWLLLCLPLMAFTPIFNDYTPENTRDEFRNVEAALQDQQHRVFLSTPNLNDLKDGELVRVSSGTFFKMMIRDNQDIYAIGVSCVTVRR